MDELRNKSLTIIKANTHNQYNAENAMLISCSHTFSELTKFVLIGGTHHGNPGLNHRLTTRRTHVITVDEDDHGLTIGEGAALNHARSWHACARAESKIVVAGGFDFWPSYPGEEQKSKGRRPHT